MIASDGKLRKVCRNYHLVENYYKAVADEELWDLHHRREIDEMKSKQQLIDEERYYDVEPSDLIFLTHSEHTKLHNINALPKTRKKWSESHKGNQNMLGKHRSEETRNKISEAMKGENNPMYGVKLCGEKNGMFGKHLSEDHKKKISEIKKSKELHWWNNGKTSIMSKECPDEGFVRGRLKFNK